MKKTMMTMRTVNTSVLFPSKYENFSNEINVDPTEMLSKNDILMSINSTYLEHAPKLTKTMYLKAIILAVMSVISLIANLATIYSVTKNRRKQQNWSAIYTLLLHLSVADLLVTIFCIGGEAVWNYTVQWIWGVDRFVAVRYPMKNLSTTHRFLRFVVFAWVLSILLATPQIVIFHVAYGPFVEEFTQCVTHGFYTEPWQEQLYAIFSIFFMFILPLTILITTYVLTVITISRSEKAFKSELINSNLQRTNSDINRRKLLNRAKTKSLRISVVIVAAFVLWWTPYYTMMIIFMFLNPDKHLSEDLQSGIFFFGMSNSLVNPLIYGAFHLWPQRQKQNCYRRDFLTLHRRSNCTSNNHSMKQLQEARTLFLSRGTQILTTTPD
ncbi:gonadotropin-releasing hormone receptor isoform X2 [Vespula pensylvanica]|uniref:gonadotropin-releasing hormone receptor isoform X2 n=1 Tax=Vespula pensylvanica TaxID=30213 RepID=UPI001CBA5D26|nr:gonadotropin-releasing hormone receptor isoform X2 [Vespula pensylvanica]